MKVSRQKKGTVCGVPTHVISSKKDGWCRGAIVEDGCLVIMESAIERHAGGAFVNDAEMLKAGYIPMGVPAAEIETALNKLKAPELRELVSRNGGPKFRTKSEMIQWLVFQ